MPTIFQNTENITLLPRVLSWAEVRQTFSDQWFYVPYIVPVSCVEACAPEVGTADFLYDFGSIMREGTSTFSTFTPYSLRDYHVRILTQEQGYYPQVVWTGIITEDEITLDQPVSLAGRQRLKAYSYAHLLDREVMSGAVIFQNDKASSIGWMPQFNVQSQLGQNLNGNRSENVGPDGVYLFGSGPDVWSNGDIVRYLCKYYSPPSLSIQLAGQAYVLNSIEQLHDFNGVSLWDALNSLIDRKRGLGFYPIIQGDGYLFLWVFTTTEIDIRVGRSVLPANPMQTFFAFPTDRPYSHLVDPIPFRVTSSQQYDRIEIMAERCFVCGTFSFRGETLEQAWSSGLEDEYDEAAGSETDDIANDAVRGRDRFRGIYCRFRVPRNWNGVAGYDETSNLLLAPNNDGTMTDEGDRVPASIYRLNKPSSRTIPFYEGFDYTQSPPVDETDDTVDPDYRPMAVWIYDATEGGLFHEKTDKLHYVERMNEINPGAGIHNASVRPLESELGFELLINPRHYFALGEFPDDRITYTDPEFAYTDLVATFAFELDQRPTITIKNFSGTPSEHLRTLRIEVPGAQFWYAGRGTIVDIDDKGEPEYVADDNRVLRDDIYKLEAYAAFCAGWYGFRRQAVQIPIKAIGLFVPLGTLLSDIRGFSFFEPVRTVVTSRSINFLAGTTVIETGYSALDINVAYKKDVKGTQRRKDKRANRAMGGKK